MANFKTLAIAIGTGAIAFGSVGRPALADEQMTCIDARPHGGLIEKHVVFERNGVRSTDMFPLLRSWDAVASAFNLTNNGQNANVKMSDWTALNVERVQAFPAAQAVVPTLVSTTQVDQVVNLSDISITDGLIALIAHGCDSVPIDQDKERVFLGKITFDSRDWHLVGQYSIFGTPSWNAAPNRKPGG